MEHYTNKNLKNIKTIIRDETGVNVGNRGSVHKDRIRKYAMMAACVMCVLSLSAFGYYKFNSLNGDDLVLSSVYLGDGKYEIIITNLSSHDLEIQDSIKVIQWSTGEPVEGNPDLIQVDSDPIAANSTGRITVDISEGYDIDAMKDCLKEDDWYYFVLTNNSFAFGQDWMCAFGFETENVNIALEEHNAFVEKIEESEPYIPDYETEELLFEDWKLPTENVLVAGYFGEQQNGHFSDHINIAGDEGDSVFAVYDGTVTEVGFENICGNYIILSVEDEILVKYGHLKEINVTEGETVLTGDEIGTMGKSGLATGVNLMFAVYLNGEAINPLMEYSGEDVMK